MKKKHLKKKQLTRLKEQFRPSYQEAQQLLFQEIKRQALALYHLSVVVYLDTKDSEKIVIELLEATTRDQSLRYPLTDNYREIIKQIQTTETGILERYSKNFVEDFASYWIPSKVNETQKSQQPTFSTIETTSTIYEETGSLDSSANAVQTFIHSMNEFPKFFVNESKNSLEIFEKTTKEDRLLATVSLTKVNDFTIEPALERKYKLKLEVIPVIEEFSSLAIEKR